MQLGSLSHVCDRKCRGAPRAPLATTWCWEQIRGGLQKQGPRGESVLAPQALNNKPGGFCHCNGAGAKAEPVEGRGLREGSWELGALACGGEWEAGSGRMSKSGTAALSEEEHCCWSGEPARRSD